MKQSSKRKETSGKKHLTNNKKGETRVLERQLITVTLVLAIAVLLVSSYSAITLPRAVQQLSDENRFLPSEPDTIESILVGTSERIMKGGIAVQSLKAGSAVVLDVRTDTLRQSGYITDSLHIPLEELIDRHNELPRNKLVVVYCENNINAAYAAAALTMQGYDAFVLENGIDEWIAAGGETNILTPPPKRG